MVLVGRKGKLSVTDGVTDIREVAWQRYEDVPTADVFGAYRYLPPDLGIVSLLGHAIDETGQTFACFLRRFDISLLDLNVARVRLWPTFKDGCEPDVFVLLESTQHPQGVALLVEAKLHAQQHDIGSRSQLGHYLVQHISDAYAEGSIAWERPQLPRQLLFITKHDEVPGYELTRARDEVCVRLASLSRDDIGLFWVNWAKVGEEAMRLWRTHRKDVATAPWLRHLLDLHSEIRDRDLLPRPAFSGIVGPPFPLACVPYARCYHQPIPESVGLANVASRSYFSSSIRRPTTNLARYCRAYVPCPISWGHVPESYHREQTSNE